MNVRASGLAWKQGHLFDNLMVPELNVAAISETGVSNVQTLALVFYDNEIFSSHGLSRTNNKVAMEMAGLVLYHFQLDRHD